MTELQQGEGLYGDTAGSAAPRPPSLLDQFTGVFSEPVALFRRLHDAPAWLGAVALNFLASLAMAGVWSRKVDVDALMRPLLERDPSLSAEQVDKVVAVQARIIVPATLGGVVVATVLALTLFALLYWLIGRGTAEGEPPTYRQALSASAVTSLAVVPHHLLAAFMCFLKPVGGLTPEKIPPTSLGYFLAVDHLKLHNLLYKLDLFVLFYLVLIFLAARHTLRLKPLGAAACVAVASLVMIVVPAVFGR